MVRQRLFNSKGILSVIRKRREDLEVKLKKYDSDELLRTSDTDVIEWLISECILDVPRLGKPRVVDYGDTSIDVGEKEVEISRNPEDTSIEGTAVTFKIPFEGDEDLFQVQPGVRRMSQTPAALLHECW